MFNYRLFKPLQNYCYKYKDYLRLLFAKLNLVSQSSRIIEVFNKINY